MNLRVRTSEPASEEFGEAVRWYETRCSGLGGEFFNAVASAIARIEANPEIGARIVRRADPTPAADFLPADLSRQTVGNRYRGRRTSEASARILEITRLISSPPN